MLYDFCLTQSVCCIALIIVVYWKCYQISQYKVSEVGEGPSSVISLVWERCVGLLVDCCDYPHCNQVPTDSHPLRLPLDYCHCKSVSGVCHYLGGRIVYRSSRHSLELEKLGSSEFV